MAFSQPKIVCQRFVRKFIPLSFIPFFVCISAFAQDQSPQSDRAYWVKEMIRISNPVLQNVANNTLHEKMPVYNDNSLYQHLEAFGRVFCGIAPWLELGPDSSEEGVLRNEELVLFRKAITNAVDPASPDYMNFTKGKTLAGTSYMAQGLLRSETQVWKKLSKETQNNIITAFKKTRKITPPENNWLLFASVIEAAILKYTGECDEHRLLHGINRFMREYYLGDGIYGDGAMFATNYYNSFVIHPMLLDAMTVAVEHHKYSRAGLEVHKKRFARLTAIQEREISPQGYYPVVGRTMICRMGVFNALSDGALSHLLSKQISPGQVRSAMTAVLRNQLQSDSNFYPSGFLSIGFAGKQAAIADSYVSTGSPYHCCTFFLALGLRPDDPFWTQPYTEWTSLKAFSGKEVEGDHGLENAENKTLILKKYLWGIHYQLKPYQRGLIFFSVLLVLISTGFCGYYIAKRKFKRSDNQPVRDSYAKVETGAFT